MVIWLQHQQQSQEILLQRLVHLMEQLTQVVEILVVKFMLEQQIIELL
jgi:hypothetical protein